MKHAGMLLVGTAALACAFTLQRSQTEKQEYPAPGPPPDISSLLNPSDSQSLRQGPAETRTFTGRISKSGQKFVLEDSSVRTFYQLDDQKKAGQYQGKNVRVTGTLDAENNVIHVQTIEEAV